MFRRKKAAAPTTVVNVVMAEEVDHTITPTPPPLPPKPTPLERLHKRLDDAVIEYLSDPTVHASVLKKDLEGHIRSKTSDGLGIALMWLFSGPEKAVSSARGFIDEAFITRVTAPREPQASPVAAAPAAAPVPPPKPVRRVDLHDAKARQEKEARKLEQQSRGCFFWWCRRPNKLDHIKDEAPKP